MLTGPVDHKSQCFSTYFRNDAVKEEYTSGEAKDQLTTKSSPL